MKIKVTDDADDLAGCSYVICALATTPLMMADNKLGVCHLCSGRIQFRPHVPKVGQKICLACASDLGLLDGDIMVTPTSIAEVKRELKKEQN